MVRCSLTCDQPYKFFNLRKFDRMLRCVQAKFSTLPNELLIQILTDFTLYELIQLSKVSSQFRFLCFSAQLWKNKQLELCCTSHDIQLLNLKQIMRYTLNIKFLQYYKCAFSNIKSLRTQGQLIESKLTSVLQFLPRLNDIQIPQSNLSSHFLITIINSYKLNLSLINVSGNRHVIDNVILAIASCPLIKVVDIGSCMNAPSSAVIHLIKTRKLKRLGLQKLYNMNDLDLRGLCGALIDNCHALEIIDLAFNHHLITQNTLELLCNALKKTKATVVVNVSNCEQLVRKNVERLQKSKRSTLIIHNTVLYDYSVESIKSYLDYILSG